MFEPANLNQFLLRLGEACGSHNSKDMAKMLRMDQQKFIYFSMRQAFPWQAIAKFAQKENMSLDWLLWGK